MSKDGTPASNSGSVAMWLHRSEQAVLPAKIKSKGHIQKTTQAREGLDGLCAI
jgi:hypothetical protein